MYILLLMLNLTVTVYLWPITDNDIRGIFIAHKLTAINSCNGGSSNHKHLKMCNECKKIVNYVDDISLATFESRISTYVADFIEKNVKDAINYSDSMQADLMVEVNRLSAIINTLDDTKTKSLVDAATNFTKAVTEYAKERISFQRDYLKNSTITVLPTATFKLVNLGSSYTTLGLTSLADLIGRNGCSSIYVAADTLCTDAYNKEDLTNVTNRQSSGGYKGVIADEINVISTIINSQTNQIKDLTDDDIFDIFALENKKILKKTLPNMLNLLHIDLKPSLEVFIKELSL